MSNRAALRRQILGLVRQFHAAEAAGPFRPGEDLARSNVPKQSEQLKTPGLPPEGIRTDA